MQNIFSFAASSFSRLIMFIPSRKLYVYRKQSAQQIRNEHWIKFTSVLLLLYKMRKNLSFQKYLTSRCQFHQPFTYKFFGRTLFFYIHVTRKSCQNATFVQKICTFKSDEIDSNRALLVLFFSLTFNIARLSSSPFFTYLSLSLILYKYFPRYLKLPLLKI
jgi:hypothetical protein